MSSVVRSRVVCGCGVVSVVGIVVSVVVIVQVVVPVTVRVSRMKRTVGEVGVPFRRVHTFELPRRVPDKSAGISFARAGGGKAVWAVRVVVRGRVQRGVVVRDSRRAGGVRLASPVVPGLELLRPVPDKTSGVSFARAGFGVGFPVRAVRLIVVVIVIVIVVIIIRSIMVGGLAAPRPGPNEGPLPGGRPR